MAFFDKLSRTVTEAGQKTIAKTMELADVTRLNSMISDEEKNINSQYTKIGKLYLSLHKNDYEDVFAEMVSTIAEAEDKIRGYKNQIQDIRGIQHCEACGAEVPKGAAFCSACGAVMPKPQSPEESIKCKYCGAETEKGARFCASCGQPLEVACPDFDVEAGTQTSSCAQSDESYQK